MNLFNFTIRIDIPAFERIAEALEGIGTQMYNQRLTLREIEQRLLEISFQLAEKSTEGNNSTLPPKSEPPYNY